MKISIYICYVSFKKRPKRLNETIWIQNWIKHSTCNFPPESAIQSIFRPEFSIILLIFEMAPGFLYAARTKSYQGHGKPCTMESSIIPYESYSIAALTMRSLVELGVNVNVIKYICR